jgi:N-acetylated-alpha-linked acidic dipeptidase
VSGPNFDASSVPSLKNFIREITKEVASPKGGTVYEQWKTLEAEHKAHPVGAYMLGSNAPADDVEVGDLGSGSDFSPFFQHAGVPSTDIGSEGPYGVYHSVFDNYAWFIKNADPTFVYEQEMARVFGLEVLHMADADVLPYDFRTYGHEIDEYIEKARHAAADDGMDNLDFKAAAAAAKRFTLAGLAVHARQSDETGNLIALDNGLRAAEEDLLLPDGLPNRPWFKHAIYAPGEYTGYAAVVIPGVNEAIEAKNAVRVEEQLKALTTALNRAAATLEGAAH